MTAKERAFVKNSYKRDHSLSTFYGGHFSDGGEVEGMPVNQQCVEIWGTVK